MIHYWVGILEIKTQHTINKITDNFVGGYSGYKDTTYYQKGQ